MTRLLLAALALLCVGAPTLAQERPRCFPYADLLRQLEAKFGEVPVAAGTHERGIVELLASDTTWTLILVRPDRTACPMADGESWEALPPRPPGTPL